MDDDSVGAGMDRERLLRKFPTIWDRGVTARRLRLLLLLLLLLSLSLSLLILWLQREQARLRRD